MKKTLIIAVLLAPLVFAGHGELATVVKEGGKVYIVDRTGERWDITQAVSEGFQPEGFQFGLGREAFTPLDDSLLSDDTEGVPSKLRVIGIAEGPEAKAYSVEKLSRHEVANSSIGSRPVSVAY